MSFRVTLACSRAEAEAIPTADALFVSSDDPPVLVAEEPDSSRPDEWLIHAYFNREPSDSELALVAGLGRGAPRTERLGEEDWVSLSQAGLQPIRAGRFFVHTPSHSPEPGCTNFEIDAGLAFGTGQHSTTSGCLAALDQLERADLRFANIADIGTGTGLLAFAALALWPQAKCIGTDIDAVAVDVARENALINRVRLGTNRGELLLVHADGMDSPLLAARTPFDLIIANILAGPLIDLAGAFSDALTPNGVIILAGLLDTQKTAVRSAYEAQGLAIADEGVGEWPVLVCKRRA